MNAGGTISVGLGARGLRDRDYFSKSDPYLVLARPSASGGFHILRTSETKKNCLSPDWADFLLRESELGPQDVDLRLRLEVFDNDYGSRDQLLGVAHLSLRQLEAAATLHSPLPLGDGKGKTKAGQLIVRSFSRHLGQGGGYPARGGGYPAQGGGHPAQGGGQLAQGGGYPGQGGGYPAQGGGYPGQGGGYPAQGGGYPGQGGGYPAQGGGYPGPGGSYPAQPVGYASPASLPYPAQPAQGMAGVYYPPQQPQGPAHPTGHPPAQPYPAPAHAATFAHSPHTGPYPPTAGPYPPAAGPYPPAASPYQHPPLYPSLPTATPSAPPAYPATHDYPATPAYPQPTTPAYPHPATYNSPCIGPGGFVTRPR